MNTEGGHPQLGVRTRGRAVCFITWELGEVYGAGTSNYSPSRSSSETCMQTRAGQVSGNRTTNRVTVTNGESAAARSPSQLPPCSWGRDGAAEREPPWRKEASPPGPGPPGGGGLPGSDQCGGLRSSRRDPGWPPSPAPGYPSPAQHLSPCSRGPRTPLGLSQGCPENRGAA